MGISDHRSRKEFRFNHYKQVLLLASNTQLSWSFDALLEAMESSGKESLRIRNIRDCSISGTIPAKLLDFINLVSIDLGSNVFTGTASADAVV